MAAEWGVAAGIVLDGACEVRGANGLQINIEDNLSGGSDAARLVYCCDDTVLSSLLG